MERKKLSCGENFPYDRLSCGEVSPQEKFEENLSQLSSWRVNYKLIEFDIKYPAVVIFFFSDLRPELELDLLHQFQEGFIQLIRLSSFFCRNRDQMQKQPGRLFEEKMLREICFTFVFSLLELNNLYFQLQDPTWTSCIVGPLRLNSPRILNFLKTEEQIREVQQKWKKLWHFEQTNIWRCRGSGWRRKRNILRQFTLSCPALDQARSIYSANMGAPTFSSFTHLFSFHRNNMGAPTFFNFTPLFS